MKQEDIQQALLRLVEVKYMVLAVEVSAGSSCLSKKVGAIVVRDHRVLGSGYNETPNGTKNCSEGGCQRCQMRKDERIASGEMRDTCLCIHAESNAIANARSKNGVLSDATLYITIPPCSICAVEIKQAGITTVITNSPAHIGKGIKVLLSLGVEVICVDTYVHY